MDKVVCPKGLPYAGIQLSGLGGAQPSHGKGVCGCVGAEREPAAMGGGRDLGGRGATLVGPKCFGGRGVSTEVLPGVG